MTSLYEVLKRSKTAPQLAPDMFTALWAKSITAGKTIELSGQVPLSFKANGAPLLDYLISGNTFQNGTPTPDNPIMPQGCGERTGNLFDKDNAVIGERVLQNRVITDAGTAHSDYIDVTGISTITVNKKYNATNFYFYADKTSNSIGYVNDFTANVPTGAKYCRINVLKDDVDTIMLNTGSTALPYEPWGIKIPILSTDTTTPVYLGEVETTRKIKKLMFDGTENWSLWSSGQPDVERYYYKWGKVTPPDYGIICTHFPFIQGDGNFEHIRLGGSARDDMVIFISKTIASTLDDFKSYLADQYAAGTPVCVWYVLATEETAVVNEPLMKIGDYADTFSKAQAGVEIPTNNGSTTLDVLTAVKPSNVSIKYRV